MNSSLDAPVTGNRRTPWTRQAWLLPLLLSACLWDSPPTLAGLSEHWNLQSETNGWFYYVDGEIGTPIRWAATGGVAGSGFVWTPLAELLPWGPTGPGALYPLHTYGSEGAGELHPINLLHTNWLTIHLHPEPPIPSPGGPADLKGGSLALWVGEWNTASDYAFYRYTRKSFSTAGPLRGWVLNQLAVSRDPNDWELIAGAAPVAGAPKPATAILADPQQWGIGIFGATAPPSGQLGFDALKVACPDQVDLSLPAGYCGIANNFFRGANTVQDVLPTPRDGTVLYKYVKGAYEITRYDALVGWDNPAMPLWPGEGVIIYSEAPQAIHFGGSQPPHPPAALPRLPAGWYLVGCRSACPNTFEEFMGFSPAEGDRVILPDCSSGIPPTPVGAEFTYTAGAWVPMSPLLEPGQGAWVQLVDCPGSVTLRVPANNFCWIANNYLLGGNTVADVLPAPQEGTTLYKYKAGYSPANVYDPVLGWSDPSMTLWPGEGAVLFSPTAQTIVFTGTPPSRPPPPRPRLAGGHYLVGCRTACPNSYEDFMGFAPRLGDRVIVPECQSGSSVPPAGPEYRYTSSGWTPGPPVLQPGQGAWVILPQPTAALLDYFHATASGDHHVMLSWGTLIELQTLGFHLDRQSPAGSWDRVTRSLVPARGADLRPHLYRWDDHPDLPSTGLRYRLLTVSLTGEEAVLAEASAAPGTSVRIERREECVVLRLSGAPGRALRLESATTLTREVWTTLETVRLDATGAGCLACPIEQAGAGRFYRLSE